ncbi:hypothetical protein [Hydrogenimonas cancrithermarum]|uniref:Uncharacterized protein n=1 Tax=Hydrogenimonas cancrithermarum TaxID=2993563 RepID=A0ABM8FPZ7_9BACT|nr:hypothetical protein [Hydrogenimonas cancrithermarum]BDY13948.1 hypothetical protein HCR_22600 [Hydrogenimonas cancrithermarum]
MAFKLHIEAEGRKIGFYKLNRLEFEGLEIDADTDFDKENITELFENINAYIESGELEELDSAQTFTTFHPDTATITLDADNLEEVEVSLDDMTLQNINVDTKLELLEKAKIGDVIFIRTEVGEAYWDISGEGEASFTLENVKFGYLDCSQSHNQYDVIREGYYDFLCDLVVPENAWYNDEKLEIDEHVLRTQQVYGELYIVRQELPGRTKEFERVDLGGPMLLDTTSTPEEFS